jgi:chromosome partitioning protein
MRVVSFVTQKGGSGKSTTAASIAVAAFQQGRRVFMLELDRPGTLSDWADARQAGAGPEFERIDATAIDKALSTLREAGYDLAVVDTPGVDSPATVAAMRAADLCFVPCRPTATDLRGCLPTRRSKASFGWRSPSPSPSPSSSANARHDRPGSKRLARASPPSA